MELTSALEWDDRVLKGIPGDLLHWFACNIAERILEWEKQAGRELHEAFWQVVSVKRLWLLKEQDDGSFLLAWDRASRLAERAGGIWFTLESPTQNGIEKSMKRATRAIADATVKTAILAARNAVKAGCVAAAVSRTGQEVPNGVAEASVWFDAKEREQQWYLRHLKYLVKVWETCGERSPFLLHEGICPIPKDESMLPHPN